MYLDTRSSWRAGDVEDVGAGKLQLDVVPVPPSTGIFTMPTNRPMPWCSWTTRSPGARSVKDSSRWRVVGSALGRRVRGIGRAGASPSARTANFPSGKSKPADSPHGDGDPAGGGQVVEALVHGGEHPSSRSMA